MSPRKKMGGRERLIRAALRSFAEDGIDAVSIRAVNRAAGVGPASVHYHFSTKDGLLDAVLLHYGEEMVEAIVAGAQELVDRGQVTAADVVQSIAEPYFDLLRTHGVSGLHWVQIIDQLLRRDRQRATSERASAIRREVARLAFPDADEEAIERALTTSVQLFITQVAQLDAAAVADEESLTATIEDLEFLVDFLAGGLAASLLEGQPTPAPL